MPTVRCVVRVEIDGRPLFGFPIERTLEPNELTNHFAYTMKHADSFRSLPTEEQAETLVVALMPDRRVTARFNAQSDRGVPLKHRGLFLLFNGALSNPRRDKKATVQVDGADPARLTGAIGGPT